MANHSQICKLRVWLWLGNLITAAANYGCGFSAVYFGVQSPSVGSDIAPLKWWHHDRLSVPEILLLRAGFHIQALTLFKSSKTSIFFSLSMKEYQKECSPSIFHRTRNHLSIRFRTCLSHNSTLQKRSCCARLQLQPNAKGCFEKCIPCRQGHHYSLDCKNSEIERAVGRKYSRSE